MKTKISALIWLISVITLSTTVAIAEAQPFPTPPPPRTVFVSVSLQPGPPPNVGSTFYVDIEITARPKVEVYAWGVELHFTPYMQAVMPLNVTEGSFLPSAGPTFFAYSVDLFAGVISIGNTLLGGPCTGGASCVPPMPNLLARVYFVCIASGPTSMELANCFFIDCNSNPIRCICTDLSFSQLP